MSLKRYSIIHKKNPREIVLLKSQPCKWGRCSFCDYIHDNSTDVDEIVKFNKEVLKSVTGTQKQLEIINSGSCFELPTETLKDIRNIVEEKAIQTLYFESHFMYRNRLDEIRNFFNAEIIFKCGIETFDKTFRQEVLKKGAAFDRPEEVSKYFSSICLMVGIEGQTKEMIARDMDILQTHFERGCVNVYIDNSTAVKGDPALIKWFEENYAHLEENPAIEVLWHNTDFGVGGEDE